MKQWWAYSQNSYVMVYFVQSRYSLQGETMPSATATKSVKSVIKSRKSNNVDKWTVVFHGLYGRLDAGQKTQKPYRVKVVIPDRIINKGPHHLFVKYYAPKLMPALYPGYDNLYTFEIESATCTDEDKERNTVSIMSREQLLAYIIDNDLPVEAELYPDSADLRQAINESTDPKSEKGFIKNQTIRRERLGDTLVTSAETLDTVEESLQLNSTLHERAKEMSKIQRIELGEDL